MTEIQQASSIIALIYQKLKSSLNAYHPLIFRALRITGWARIVQGDFTDASDVLRRALTSVERVLRSSSRAAPFLNIS